MSKPKLIVLTGAGISAESGLKTFRGNDGLWENYKIEDVASIDGWHKNPELVLEFYERRRQQAMQAKPNEAHLYLVDLEKDYEVQIITQNVDDLHERAGSSQVLHLHGSLMHYKSTNSSYRGIIQQPLKLGQLCPNGHQLRPDIVWFGEDVPLYPEALDLVRDCDVLLIIGTSLQVYPAAGLAYQAPSHSKTILVDPYADEIPLESQNTTYIIRKKATLAWKELKDLLV